MKRIILAAVSIMIVMAVSGCSADDADKEKATSDIVTTTEKESKGPEFEAARKKYYDYISDCFGKEPEEDGGEGFVFHVLDKEGSVGSNLGFLYYDTKEMASKYMETATMLFSDDDLKEYKAGDEGVLYESKADSDDATDTEKILPSYIFVRQGTKVYYAVYYDGYKEKADEFIKAMTE